MKVVGVNSLHVSLYVITVWDQIDLSICISIIISLNLLTVGSHTIVSSVFGLSEVKQPNN